MHCHLCEGYQLPVKDKIYSETLIFKIMDTHKVNLDKMAPVLMAFFVMSFVDLVGVAVDRVSTDMDLSATLAQLIPSATLLWFFLLSVPVGVMQSRLGKRNTLNIGMGVTALGLLVPFLFYTFEMVLVGFALLGIGNTIVQVSANPLLVDVVTKAKSSIRIHKSTLISGTILGFLLILYFVFQINNIFVLLSILFAISACIISIFLKGTSSFLSFSQFVKAIGSMLGAPLAAVLAAKFGDWKLLFLVFGVGSILSALWLSTVKIEESKQEGFKVSLASSFKLLSNGFILLMVLSIFLVVGIDVGFNSNSGQFLIKHFGIEQTAAESGRSVYFFGRMLGTFAGAIMLTKISSRKFFMWTSLLGTLFLVAILLIKSPILAWGLIFLIGLAVANIWPLVFSLAVEKYPERSNEISGLMMMAISGGAVIPLLVGWLGDISSISVGMLVLVACMVYLWIVSIYCLKSDNSK
jgi:MFS transporter, FHS family, L-fucose permease